MHLLRDILWDDTPTASDDEQPCLNNDNSNEEAPSPPASTTTEQSTRFSHRDLPCHTVTPKRPVPRVFRHRKIIKAAKTSPNNSGALLSELQKTNATMLALAQKIKKPVKSEIWEKKLSDLQKITA